MELVLRVKDLEPESSEAVAPQVKGITTITPARDRDAGMVAVMALKLAGAVKEQPGFGTNKRRDGRGHV
jgi:hypothetical protein